MLWSPTHSRDETARMDGARSICGSDGACTKAVHCRLGSRCLGHTPTVLVMNEYLAQNRAKPGKSVQKSVKSAQNPKKFVEIGDLGLTLLGSKSHCNERRVLRTRMNTGVSCKRCLGRTPSMRYA